MKTERAIRRRTIWKFPLSHGVAEVQMPLDAEVACFDFQNGAPCIWAIVDPDVLSVTRRFEIFGTGHPLPAEDECCYVGTTQDGPFVWHLFELL
jgi:hypothetical protein